MTPTSQRPGPAALGALALVVALGGGCHLIFPFEYEAPEPDADQTSDAMIDAAPNDAAAPDLLADLAPVDAGSCPCTAADFDGDGDVDGTDLAKLQGCYKKVPLPKDCAVADTDGDGDVDAEDLNCLGLWMGKICP